MTVTMEQVREQLIPIEPDYAEAAKLGLGAMPHLEKLAASDDLILAPRAVYLASLIGGDDAGRLLLNATKSPFAEVRVQAAASARNLPNEATTEILLKALDDSDFGVRNFALKSIKSLSTIGTVPEALQKKIVTLSKSDPDQFIRKSSNDLLLAHPRND